MARSTTKELTSGSPMKLILGFAVPLLFGMLFQQFYSLMDTIIVGRYLGVTALAAVGATGSINFLIIGFCQGICNGFGLPVAQRFGARDYDGVRKYVGNSAILSVLIGGVLTALTVIFCRQILVLMQTPSDIIDLSYNYIVVIFAGIPAIILYNILSSYLRSLGDSITPVIFLIVDEAYIDFGGESALPLIDKYDNVIVVQTFSKSRSLAGSRIGFAISNPTLIKYLNDVKYSFNSYTMDRITIALGTASIHDRAYFEQTTEKIIKTREWTKEQLRALGFVFGDSKSNFIFAMHPDVSGVELFEALKKNDIYVRHFGKPARINEYLRITIGTDEQMHKLIDFLKKYLNK
jgi:hypothetical protein